MVVKIKFIIASYYVHSYNDSLLTCVYLYSMYAINLLIHSESTLRHAVIIPLISSQLLYINLAMQDKFLSRMKNCFFHACACHSQDTHG